MKNARQHRTIQVNNPDIAQNKTAISTDDLVVLTRKESIELKCRANYWKAQHRRAIEREALLKEKLQQSQAQIRDLKQRLYGKKSEKGKGKNEASPKTQKGSPRKKGQQKGSKGHGRTQRADLPVVEETHDLPPEEKRCSICGGARPEFFKTEDSDIIEIQVSGYIRRIKRKQYKPCHCEKNLMPGIITAPPAARVIPKSSFGISVLTEVLLDKFLYSRATNRLCMDFGYLGLPVSQGTITGALKRLIPLFEPLAQAMLDKQMTERLFHNDETRWMVFEIIEGKTGYRWYLWITQSASVAYYRIAPGRGADVPIEHFSAIPEDVLQIIVVCDRYSAYKKLARKCSFILLAFCWAHVRRDFLDAARSWPEYEQWMHSWVDDIGQLYKINAARLEHWDQTRPLAAQSQAFAEQQLVLTQKLSQMVERRDEHLKEQKLAHPKKKVLESLKNHWHGLTLFVDHPQVPMDNNTAERGVRNPVTGRKNFYGSGSTWSATLAAMMFTLLQTILLWGINPRHWLDRFLGACAENGGTPPTDLSPFLPWQMDEHRKQTLSRPPPSRIPFPPNAEFESYDSS